MVVVVVVTALVVVALMGVLEVVVAVRGKEDSNVEVLKWGRGFWGVEAVFGIEGAKRVKVRGVTWKRGW